jgi:hypothetical protein
MALAIALERARLTKTPIEILIMFDIGNPVLWILGILVFAAVFLSVRGRFSAEERERRRRERSRGPVISRKKGPAVRLAVDGEKPERNRKR